MIRKLLLPLVAVALLGGCVTSGYSYRQGSGDYYYGAPSVEYRYYSPYPYGSPYYSGSYRYGYPYGYYGQSPYGYGYPYAYPYYGTRYYYYGTTPRPPAVPTPDRTRSHWRDLEQLRRRSLGEQPPRHTGKPLPRLQPRSAPIGATMPMPQPRIEMPSQQPRSAPAPRGDSSALGGMVRRSRKSEPADETSP